MANFILALLCCFLSLGLKASTDNSHVNRIRMIVSGGDQQPFVFYVRTNHEEYARFRKLKYRYFEHAQYKESLRKLEPNWIKIVALSSALNDNEVPENSWVAWVDFDAVIDDFEHELSIFDRYIQTYASNGIVDVIAASDCDCLIRFNTGVLLFRKNRFSRNLVNAWWDHRLASKIPSKDQAMLIEVVKEQDLESKGKFKVVPQRENDLNINTFTEGYGDFDCSARPGDYVTQPAGSDYKLERVFSRLADMKHSLPLSTYIYFCFELFSHQVSEIDIWSMQPEIFSEATELISGVLTSKDFYTALPVISILTVVSLGIVYYMSP